MLFRSYNRPVLPDPSSGVAADVLLMESTYGDREHLQDDTGEGLAEIVKDTAQMFVAGPPVVARIGEHLGKNELGGSDIHARNGAVDDEVDSEDAAFACARRFLSYLPSSVHELPPRAAPLTAPPARGLPNVQ